MQAVIGACTPIVALLRTNGQPVAGDNLERALIELAGGTGSDVTNADRIEGSVNVETPKERAAREADAALRAKLDELSPEPRPDPKARGRWTYDVPQRFIPDEEAS